jgi:hypothetical protein
MSEPSRHYDLKSRITMLIFNPLTSGSTLRLNIGLARTCIQKNKRGSTLCGIPIPFLPLTVILRRTHFPPAIHFQAIAINFNRYGARQAAGTFFATLAAKIRGPLSAQEPVAYISSLTMSAERVQTTLLMLAFFKLAAFFLSAVIFV